MTFIKKYWDLVVWPGAMLGLYFILLGGVGHQISTLELMAVLFSTIGLSMIQRQWAWGNIVVLIGQFFFIAYFLPMQLWGQTAFSIIWAILNIITFINWSIKIRRGAFLRPGQVRTGRKNAPLHPSAMNPVWYVPILIGLMALSIAVAAGGWIALLDWSVVYLGLIGQVALVRKKIDGWYLWGLMNLMALILFAMIGAWLLVARAFINYYIYIAALRDWGKQIRGRA